MRTRNFWLLSAGMTVALLAPAGAWAADANDAAWATPAGVTMEPLGKAQAYDLGKQSAAYLVRDQIAYTDAKGMTLYTYALDEPGKSNCFGECTATWKPLSVVAGAKAYGNWTIVVRTDGTNQWALKGKPLYTYVKDVDPGSLAGNSPARFGSWRIDGAGKPVGSTSPGHGAGKRDRTPKVDLPMPEGWAPALAFPVTDVKLPDGITAREVPDANGIVLVNHKDQTLYTFEGVAGREPKDDKWIPAPAPQVADSLGDFGFVARADGVRQWTYKGKGLYTYALDLGADAAFGIGVDKRWKVAALVNFYLPPNVALTNTPGLGKILATTAGKTLYRRDGYIFQSGGGHNLRRGQPQRPAVGRDIGANAMCGSECQKMWRPFVAGADAEPRGFWGIVVRDDGSKQWSYQGYALWTYAGDKRPGDMTGNDVWDYVFAGTPHVANDAKRPKVDVGTPMDGTPALYWAAAIP